MNWSNPTIQRTHDGAPLSGSQLLATLRLMTSLLRDVYATCDYRPGAQLNVRKHMAVGMLWIAVPIVVAIATLRASYLEWRRIGIDKRFPSK
jgi:hypothetical protein